MQYACICISIFGKSLGAVLLVHISYKISCITAFAHGLWECCSYKLFHACAIIVQGSCVDIRMDNFPVFIHSRALSIERA